MSDYAAYVFYVNRPELLDRAIKCFPHLHSELIVVDNSSGEGVERDLYDAGFIDTAAFVSENHGRHSFRPPVPMTYSQACNWMLKDAQRKGASLILHFHSDAHSTNPNAVQELLAIARKDKAEGKRVCCWYTLHDILWCINVEALADIGGCDTNFFSYFTDNDLSRRWELAGWTRVNSGVEGISHAGSATINSDPKLKCAVGRIFPLQGKLYELKWGGEPGKEKFTHPYGYQEFDLKP